jgi:predicted ATPase/DNA-binding winged helix-turn-helix (wHTH) protein
MTRTYRFGTFELRPIERQLVLDGESLCLGSRAFDVLLALVEGRHRALTKDELLDLAWPGLVVEENNLQAQVSALRRVLGRHAIATIPGVGYRFAVPVVEEEEPAAKVPGSRSHLTNLPAATEELVGRERDLRELLGLVRAHRLVTIVGAAGIGKSRLAQEAARILSNTFPDGVWRVDVSVAGSPAGVGAAIATATGVTLGNDDACDRLHASLAGRHLLLLLDNWESLPEAAAALATGLLGSAPGIRILVTSQDALRVPGEHLVRLGTFGVPPPGSTLDEARRYDAVTMLERRAQAIDRRFRLTEENVAAAIGICRHVDGIALAIEMAAARVPVMGLEALDAELGESLRILRSNERDAPPHHRTMEAMLDWSCAGLPPEERQALRSLAAFVGSMRRDCAVEAVSGTVRAGESAVDILGALAEKSRLQVEGTEPPRYRLLATMRLHLLDRLAREGERDRAFERHGRIMARLAGVIEADYWTLPADEWLRRHLPDREDLQAAFVRAHARGDAQTAGAVIDALRWLDFERDSPGALRPLIHMAVDLLPAASPPARARLLNGITTFRRLAVEGIVPLDLARDRVAAWRSLGDRRQLYLALTRLAVYGAHSGAAGETDLALAEARSLDDGTIPARMLAMHADNAADIGWVRGDASMTRTHAAELQSLAPRSGSARMATVARLHFAKALILEGQPLNAATALARVAEQFASIGLHALEGYAQSLRCGALLAAGRFAAAREAAAAALPVAMRNGNSDPLLEQVGIIAALDGCPLEAAQLMGFLGAARREAGTIRPPAHERLAQAARAAIDRALSEEERGRLGQAGARLGLEQIAALATAVLA